MPSWGWFLLGGATAYFLTRGLGGGINLNLSAGAGAGGRPDGRSFRGAQAPSEYQPLGTVGGFPDANSGAFYGVLGFGANGALAANPQGYADQFPAQSNGSFDPKGISVDGNRYDGCLGGGLQ